MVWPDKQGNDAGHFRPPGMTNSLHEGTMPIKKMMMG